MTSEKIHLVSTKVLATKDELDRYSLNLKFTVDSLSISENKLVLFGVPLTLFDSESGSNVLGVYVSTADLSISDDHYFYKGNKFAFAEDASGNNVFKFETDSGTDIYAEDTIWCGQKMAINENGAIIAKAVTGDVSSYETLSIGGVPIRVVIIDGRKYLVVKSILA